MTRRNKARGMYGPESVIAASQLQVFDVATHLRSTEEMAAYLEACIAESEGDPGFISRALADIARAQMAGRGARGGKAPGGEALM